MTPRSALIRLAAALALSTIRVAAQPPAPALPEAPGRDTVQRVCGACHPATVVLGRGMTREEWGQVVGGMISRGAKGSPADFATVTGYLAKNLPPKGSGGHSAAPRRAGGGGLQMGPIDEQVVDADAADRGSAVYKPACAGCHGALARGGPNGPDLVRSVIVLHDRYGSTLSPYLRDTHPAVQGRPLTALTDQQSKDLSHFLHQAVGDTLRSGPYTKVLNVLTGDPRAGVAYFNGPGACGTCHSVSGDLAGIASRYDPPTLQQRLLFPRTVSFGRSAATSTKPVTIKVSFGNEQTVTGTLLHMDDFDVALRDDAGVYHSWKRTPQLKIETNDPYAAHDDLLDKMTDPDIHNLVAYLETLK